MKFCHPEINHVFDTEVSCVNTLVIENEKLFFRVITDLQNQIEGGAGRGVLSENDKVLQMDKRAEIIDRFVPFSLNQRTLLTKIGSTVEKRMMEEDCYLKTMELLGSIETYLYDVSLGFSGDLIFDRLTPATLVKASDFRLNDDYTSLGEKVLDYMELVNEYICKKIFFTVNLRSYLANEEAELFMESLIRHGFHCIMIESVSKALISYESRYLVDEDLCEI